MTAKVLMVQGTSSDVGKSLMVAALCRIYARRGWRVAPFKSQNMALNSAVTPEGFEIGRAQAVQAAAAGIRPSVLMNPILLKPQSETGCQVVLNGKVAATMSAGDYHSHKPKLRDAIATSLAALRANNDLVIIEGAGSPVEMNLKAHDIANMFVAELCDAPVLIVADIDRGGVFASLVGTMALLEGTEHARVRGFLINKFRGDPALLGDSADFIKAKTGVPVLGVVPHLRNLQIADEDSVALASRSTRFASGDSRAKVAVIRFPHISNYDDLLPLEREPGLDVAFVRDAQSISEANLLVLPGSKCTSEDLLWLRSLGLDLAIIERAKAAAPILGICGGCQMLGARIDDPNGIESSHPSIAGLGLLSLVTTYKAEKTTAEVRARSTENELWQADGPLEGYEIHMGVLASDHAAGADALNASEVTRDGSASAASTGLRPAMHIVQRNDAQAKVPDGGVSENGLVVGTMIHGILDNDELRHSLLRRLGVTPNEASSQESEFDRLADAVAAHVDMAALDHIIGIPQSDDTSSAPGASSKMTRSTDDSSTSGKDTP